MMPFDEALLSLLVVTGIFFLVSYFFWSVWQWLPTI